MTLEDIFALWEVDSQIDSTKLGHEVLSIPQLHSKYWKIYIQEKFVLKDLEAKQKQLKLAKYEFYTLGPHEETPSDWKLPSFGRVIKSDVGQYLESDKDIIALNLRIGMQNEKVDFLESIIRSLRDRGFNIRTAVDYEKFKNGG